MADLGLFWLYVLAAMCVGIVMLIRLWRREQKRRAERRRFLAEFDPTDLRMNPRRLGRVYHVISVSMAETEVITIWDAGAPVIGGDAIRMLNDELMPFDPTRFS